MPANLPAGTETPLAGRFLLAMVFAGLGSTAMVAAWLAPNHYPPWTSFHGELAAFGALCFFCVARACVPAPTFAGRAPVLFLGFIALVWVQWALGLIAYRGDALLSSMYLGGLALAWWLGANCSNLEGKPDPLAWLATLFVIGATLSVFIALLQWLRMESAIGIFAAERGPSMRAFGNLGQPNHLSSLALMATVFAFALYTRGIFKLWHLVSVVAWLSLGFTFAESRSGLLAALVIGALLLAKGFTVPRLTLRNFVIGWWTLLLALALAWPALNEWLYLQPPRDAQLTHDNARAVMWKQALAGIGESPWVGYGWRQSMSGQKVGANFVEGWLATDYAHNIVLDALLWLGVPLGAFLSLAAGWWILRALVRVRGPTQVLLYAALVPLIVHSLFEFPFAYSYFVFPAAWMLGLLQQLQAPVAAGRARALVRQGVLAFTVLFIALGAAILQEYLAAEEDYRVMRFELRRVGKLPAGYSAPDLVLLTQLGELLTLGRFTPSAGMPQRDIERLRRASETFGWAMLDLSYAVALGLNGKPQQASHQLANLRGVYGEQTYAQAKQRFLELRAHHPDLAAVTVP